MVIRLFWDSEPGVSEAGSNIAVNIMTVSRIWGVLFWVCGLPDMDLSIDCRVLFVGVVMSKSPTIWGLC